MAAQFFHRHGSDIDSEMDRVQNTPEHANPNASAGHFASPFNIYNASLGNVPAGIRWTVRMNEGLIDSVREYEPRSPDSDFPKGSIDANGALLSPSFCHPHVHLDKAFLLSHPKYAHLQIEHGTFEEAMSLTGQAKALFEFDDLRERGQRLIDESVRAGVSHMRAFVEVDAGVGHKCLEAGLSLKRANERTCIVQLCAFAQLPLFSPSKDDESGDVIRSLIRKAAGNSDITAIGSTPYVETNTPSMKQNIDWMIDLSIEFGTHLDFHLDYNLDHEIEPLVWYVIDALQRKRWVQRVQDRTIVLGHCTRLTLFDPQQWRQLATKIQETGLPISFVGLPTSDMFMMRTNQQPDIRGTLHIPELIQQYRLNACMGINNIGNAFTPQGSCDPLSLACQGVAIYQAGTSHDTEALFESVSTRAKSAIGFQPPSALGLDLQPGQPADLILFAGPEDTDKAWQTIKTVSDAVYLYDHCLSRIPYFRGQSMKARRD